MDIHPSDLRLIGAIMMPTIVGIMLFPPNKRTLRLYLRAMRPW